MNLFFTVSYIVWFLSEIFYNVAFRAKNSTGKITDKGSLLLIWVVILAGILISINLTVNFPALISNAAWVPYFGLALIWTGVLLRLWVVISLGKFFTVQVTIKHGHRLKTNGFYKYLRHPSYAMSLLAFVGFGVSLNNWIALVFITAAILFAFGYRIRIEEKVLIAEFGQEYLDYKKKTKALLPFLF